MASVATFQAQAESHDAAQARIRQAQEAGTLSIESQQSLLTAIQMKQMPISGRSPGSSGSMVRTEAVLRDVVLVLAGNHEDVAGLHPALRSRIRGYGYEVLMATEMPDTPENWLPLTA